MSSAHQKAPEAPPAHVWPEVRLCLVSESGKSYKPDRRPPGRPVLDKPQCAARYLALRLGREPFEVLGALYLDTRQRLLCYTVLYRGTLDRAAVEPRGILCAGLLANASGILLFHNHPSGDATPSAEDLAFTRRLDEAARVVGIRLHDHLIIGSGSGFAWTSLRERGGW